MISQFYFNYAMLVLNSFGLQNALERAPLDLGHFFGRVHTSAYTCATLVRDSLGPAGFMKYSPDSHFVQTSYAVLSLLKVRFVFFLLNLLLAGNSLFLFVSARSPRIPGLPRQRAKDTGSRPGCCGYAGQHRCEPLAYASAV